MKSFGAERSFTAESEIHLSEQEEKLYNLLVPENRSRAIDIKSFEDLYGKPTIARDQERVSFLEKEFEKGQEEDPMEKTWVKRGALFEAIVNDQIESSNWLGENASVIVPSRYDDVENGIDSVIEFQEEVGKSHLALAIDVTKSTKGIEKKLENIRRSIDEEKLSRMKYFQSEDMRGELREVPRVIIGADQNTIREVTDLLLTFKTRQKFPTAGKPGEFKAVREQLEHHRLQFMVLLEIKKQLDAFERYAARTGKPKIAKKYEEARIILENILSEKDPDNDYHEMNGDLLEDQIYRHILDKAEIF